ncbi:type II toxin-antitoxin system RelE/ParE family toxin [Desulfocurvibacter africanus]|uniref:Plasmid stabilization system n=1 Tax=Desulfocurvibacter africanus subsp. africanus str. Walvis Bay TaxID=690850 RepID=F3YXH5_DESAF|nr:type II toxin-antitoxin system RelE/ParE family toxin [Desulfocurvibacter africanus]EGJ51752.1 plasmid stabilization system [Desulfocurvibacter africanus subsp. africanus str. Walvis Bay]
MPARPVRWLRQALRDMDEIATFIAMDDPRTARDVAGRIWEAAGTLGQSPERGRIGRVPGTREPVLPNLPYFLAYRVREGEVQILRVIHQRRQRE